jgi:hypothetical protein
MLLIYCGLEWRMNHMVCMMVGFLHSQDALRTEQGRGVVQCCNVACCCWLNVCHVAQRVSRAPCARAILAVATIMMYPCLS